VRTSSGSLIRKPLILERTGGRIYFWDEQMKKSPWGFKDEIKSMAGSHFHGYDDEGDYAKKMVGRWMSASGTTSSFISSWARTFMRGLIGRSFGISIARCIAMASWKNTCRIKRTCRTAA